MQTTISTGARLGLEGPLRFALVPECHHDLAPDYQALGQVWLLKKKYALLKEHLEQADKIGCYAEQQRIRNQMRMIANGLGISQSLL